MCISAHKTQDCPATNFFFFFFFNIAHCIAQIGNQKRSLKIAAGQLDDLFKKLLLQNSQPLDLKIVTSSDRKDIPPFPQSAVQTLVTIAKSLADIDLDPNATPTGYLKSYCEIRANCMIKSLTPLNQSSMVELRGVYDKGSSPFIPYTSSLLKLCRVMFDLSLD